MRAPKPRALAVALIGAVVFIMVGAGCIVSASMGGQVVGALLSALVVSRVFKLALRAVDVRPDVAGVFAGIATWLAALAVVDASGRIPIEVAAVLYGAAGSL